MNNLQDPDDFRSLAENAPVMMWRAALDRRYDWFNRCWLNFTGETLPSSGDGWADRIHPADVDQYRRIVSAAFDAQQPFDLEYRMRRHDGVFRWVLDSGRPRFSQGAFAGFLGSCVDINDHRSAELNLRAAMEERDILLREVHHRVKNNMQTLMALIRFMRRTADPGGQALLDALNARLVAMAIVQRYLHTADNMTEVSVRTLLSSVATQLADTELGVDLQLADSSFDLVLPAQAAAYTGLATAEAAVLFGQCGATRVLVDLQSKPAPSVAVSGSAKKTEISGSQLGMRLIRQYARGAGAAASLGEDGDAAILVFSFPQDVPRSP
jgi:PAS domain S-box-containing protein